jgi:hypothetical protein
MNKINKTMALFLTLIISMSCLTLLVVKPTNAQSMTKPLTPQFVLSFVNSSYTRGSDYVQNESIVVSINNQPFTSYYVDVHSVDLYYKIRWNASSTGELWASSNNSVWVLASNCRRDENGVVLNPNAAITDVRIDFSANNYTYPLGLNPPLPDIPVGGQADFQVQALIGYFSSATFYGNSSDWSNTQTITIHETFPTTSPIPNPTPTPVPELQTWTIPLLLSLIIAAAGLLVYHKIHKHNVVPTDSCSITKNRKIINIHKLEFV